MPDHVPEDKGGDEDEWEPAPSPKKKVAGRGRKKNASARIGRGGKKRQAVDTDSQELDTAEDKEEQLQLVSGHAKGKQRRKQQVIEDDNLEDVQIAKSDSCEPLQAEAGLSKGSGAATDAADAIPQSSAALQADVLGTKEPEASEQLAGLKGAVGQNSRHNTVPSSHNGTQDTQHVCTSHPAHLANSTGSAQPASEFSLLDAILNPDNGKRETASGLLTQGKITLQRSQTDSGHASQNVEQAQTVTSKAGQPQDTDERTGEEKVSEFQTASCHPPVKGSLRERMKAFAALKK